MKVNIYGRVGDEELTVTSQEIEYADTGNDSHIAITLKRGAFIHPAIMLGTIEGFGGMALDTWEKHYKDGTEKAHNINLPKANFWIEVRA